MEVKSANVAMSMNRAATAVDNSGSEGNGYQAPKRVESIVQKEAVKPEEEYVKVSISAAGLQKSKTYEDVNSDEAVSREEAEEMMKKVEGLSSQVINGNFSIADRLTFQAELKELTSEMNHLQGEGISFKKSDNHQLSQKISDLTTRMNEAAVYHKSAKAYFIVKSQKMYESNVRTKLDIAI